MVDEHDNGLGDFLDPLNPLSDIGGEVERVRKQLELDEDYKQWLEDLRAVATTPEGARFICRLSESLGVGSPAYRKGADVYAATALKDFGDDLMADLAVASDITHGDITRMLLIRRKAAERLETNKS